MVSYSLYTTRQTAKLNACNENVAEKSDASAWHKIRSTADFACHAFCRKIQDDASANTRPPTEHRAPAP